MTRASRSTVERRKWYANHGALHHGPIDSQIRWAGVACAHEWPRIKFDSTTFGIMAVHQRGPDSKP